jgi:hypothetical protein
MQSVISQLVDLPFARMFILSGIIFLLVAVLGKVEGKIDPGQMGRIGASVLGVVLLIVGVLLQFSERDSNIDRLTQQVRAQMQVPAITGQAPVTASDAAAPKQAAEPSAVPKPLLKIVAGTWGRACNGKPGNATPLLAKACDGKSACDYAAEPVDLGPGQESCAKDFVAEWKCGSGSTVYSATLPADAGKAEKLHLECGG